jgi:hypothetical protein
MSRGKAASHILTALGTCGYYHQRHLFQHSEHLLPPVCESGPRNSTGQQCPAPSFPASSNTDCHPPHGGTMLDTGPAAGCTGCPCLHQAALATPHGRGYFRHPPTTCFGGSWARCTVTNSQTFTPAPVPQVFLAIFLLGVFLGHGSLIVPKFTACLLCWVWMVLGAGGAPCG